MSFGREEFAAKANVSRETLSRLKVYADILTPDFSLVCKSIGLAHEAIKDIKDFDAAFARAMAMPGPCMIEVDMVAIGPFSQSFAGPPAGAAGQ